MGWEQAYTLGRRVVSTRWLMQRAGGASRARGSVRPMTAVVACTCTNCYSFSQRMNGAGGTHPNVHFDVEIFQFDLINCRYTPDIHPLTHCTCHPAASATAPPTSRSTSGDVNACAQGVRCACHIVKLSIKCHAPHVTRSDNAPHVSKTNTPPKRRMPLTCATP